MKYLVVSDIHGALDSTEFILDVFVKESVDKILLLGDVLYHGPRNDLPNSYFPKKVIERLNQYKDKILCIKGNCDAEVDQMVLDFDIIDSYDGILNDISVHLEHGHHLDEYKGNNQLVLFGHTHIPANYDKDNIHFINPGSITIPKENSKRSFIIWEDHTLSFYDMDMNLYDSYKY